MGRTNGSFAGSIDAELSYAVEQRLKLKERAFAPPAWLVRWKRTRSKTAMELFAEFFGVLVYLYMGLGTAAALQFATYNGTPNAGSLLGVALAYGFGVIFSVLLSGPISGAHLNPSFTVAFWLLRGFPGRKVLPYILVQILGAFTGSGMVYLSYKEQLDAFAADLILRGRGMEVFSPSGPAAVFALSVPSTQNMGHAFVLEFFACLISSIIVFAVMDQANKGVSKVTAPIIIGVIYATTVVAFGPGCLSLNLSRDLGGRLLAGCVWGWRGAFPGPIVCMTSLTNIAVVTCGGLVQMTLLSPGGDDDDTLLLPMTVDATTMAGLAVLSKTGHADTVIGEFEKDAMGQEDKQVDYHETL